MLHQSGSFVERQAVVASRMYRLVDCLPLLRNDASHFVRIIKSAFRIFTTSFGISIIAHAIHSYMYCEMLGLHF